MGCKKCCHEEFQCSNFLLTHQSPQLFVQSQWKIHPGFYIAWRVLSAVFLLSWLIYSGTPEKSYTGVIWMIFLTNWCFFMLNLSAILQAVIVLAAHVKQKKLANVEVIYEQMPWYLKCTWVIYNTSSCSAIVVSLAYWVLLFPELGISVGVLDFMTHGWNSIYVLLDLCITGTPIRIYHMYHSIIYSLVYVFFSVIFEFSTGAEFIYPILDWSKDPASAALYSFLVVFLVTPLVWTLIYAIYRIRLAIFNAVSRNQESKEELHPL